MFVRRNSASLLNGTSTRSKRAIVGTENPMDALRSARGCTMSPDRCMCRRLGHPPAVSPQVVGSHVLGQLLQWAANYLGHSQVSKAVIAVPAKFDARQRAATVEAFRLAGLQVCFCDRVCLRRQCRVLVDVLNKICY